MPDEPRSVEAAEASDQQGLAAAAGELQAEPVVGEAAPASVTPAPEPNLASQLAEAKQALSDSKGQIEKLQKDIQAAKSDGGNARELTRELRATKQTLAEVQAQVAGIAAQFPHLFGGTAEDATKAAEEARRPFAERAQRSVAEQQQGHAQTILSSMRRAGFKPEEAGFWEEHQEFAPVRQLYDKGQALGDLELTELAAGMAARLLEGRTNGGAAQAQPGNGASPAVAAKPAQTAATVQQPARPRAGLDLDAGSGVGAGAVTIDALAIKIADGYIPTAAEQTRIDDYFAQLLSGR